MIKPILNPKLSLRARSLFYYYVEKGRVLSADELWQSKEVPEGRDAILAALNELKDSNYVKSVRVKIGNSWRMQYKFTESAKKFVGETSNGFSGHLYSGIASSLITSTNIVKDTNVSLTIGAAPLKEEVMGWDLDGEKETPKKKFGAQIEDSDAGAVGKVVDRQARLNAKYKPTKAENAGRNRIDTPEDLWSTNDLVAEFYDLVKQAVPNTPDQVNSRYVATWINKKVGEGVQRISLLKAMRMFFEDTRNLHDTGIGKPLWQRFFAYYQTVHGIVNRSSEPEYSDDDFTNHQEKMLKLLGGE
jgi:hypothetical protein